MEKISKILIVFKTHLDMGFTDLAKNIVGKYMNSFIPQALQVAKQLRERGGDERFIWTTGSWLISKYLEVSDAQCRENMLSAIENGDISWHGLPFTTHTEIMNAELFCHGLKISQKLDERFERKTIAAKLTDVPGHTKAMIPLLVKSGIEFLHIGVNPASKPVDVPELFRWQGVDGSKIAVMYSSGSYGKFSQISGTETAVYFAHTGDNTGPQSADSIIEVYAKLRLKYPDAELVACDLNMVGEEVLKVQADLPIISGEMGDSWIHGTCSNPQRASQYREMLRLLPDFSQIEQEKAMDYLLIVPEHTWGLDEKTFLNDHHNMVRSDFEKVCKSDRYSVMKRSWDEQNEYVFDSVKVLSDSNRKLAMKRIENYKKAPIDFSEYTKIENPFEEMSINGYEIQINKNGAICRLERNGVILSNDTHLLGFVKYELFSEREHAQYAKQYITSTEDWAVEDFGKIGMEEAISEYQCDVPRLTELYRRGNELIVCMEFSEKCRALFGAPKKASLSILLENGGINFDFAWWNKPANRTPESFWIGFFPIANNVKISKLGEWIDPLSVLPNGGRGLHGTDWGIKYDEISIKSLDALAVAVGKTSLWNFDNKLPCADDGVYFNLYNNVWGTNFTMWYDKDARFRFEMKF